MKNFNGPFCENFLFQLKKKVKKKKKKKNRDPTISAVTNIHTRFYIQVRQYPSTGILPAALKNRYGIGNKGGYFRLGMWLKFGP